MLTALLDSGAQVNLVAQEFVIQWELEPASAQLPTPQWLDGNRVYCYGAYEPTYWLVDSWGQGKECTTLFYAVDQGGPDLILGMPALAHLQILLDAEASQWRFKVKPNRLEINPPEAFAEAVEGEQNVYAVVCVAKAQREDPEEPPGLPPELFDFKDVFSSESASALPPLKDGDHAIELDGRDPPYGPLYNLSQKELAELRRYLEEALQKGWIRHSTSPAGAPILFVPKKDGGLRLCVDYRGLNAVTVKNRHPLPLITETLDRLSGARVFTKLDLKDAYHRIRIKLGDEWKTAFRTRYGHYEYMVMPFGLANAPATFQAYINKALAGLVDTICVVYLDDILIYSATPEKHWDHVREVLERLRQYKLYGNLKKCEFSTTKVEFLGFIVSTEGVSMDAERVRTVRDWPRPQSYREVQVFLGFANFYRRFIHHYSDITAPLSGLLKGSKEGKKTGPLEWSESAEQAFQSLREVFSSAPLLRHFNPSRKLRLETDASEFAIAGILSQPDDEGNYRPIAFWSRKMIPAEQNYEVHDQELLAIVAAFKQWRHYLEGSAAPVEVLTDHNNLRGFMKQKELSPRQARWALKLAAFDFEIFHRAGKTNPADAPSRRPDYEGPSPLNTQLLPTLQNKLALWSGAALAESKQQVATALGPVLRLAGVKVVIPRKEVKDIAETAYEGVQEPTKKLIRELQAQDDRVSDFKNGQFGQAELVRRHGKGWALDLEGLLRHDGCLYVPGDSALKQELISKCHDDPLAGHFGADKTGELLMRKYYWPSLKKEVREYVHSCDVCQRIKAPRHRPYGELRSLPGSRKPWKELTMDFITGLPPSKRNGSVHDAILVVVDRCTRMVRYLPTTKKIDSAALADLFFEEVVLRYGMPDGIVSDRGSVFTSSYWSSLCYHAQMKHRLSTAFHPQTDGLTERTNQALEQYLRAFADKHQTSWARQLPMAEYAYMNSHHTSIGTTPFYAMYGYHPEIRWTVGDDLLEGKVPATNERIKRLQALRDELAERWREASESQKKYYNRKHKPKSYKVGDLVMLSTKNLNQKKPSKKLSPRFVGPFRVQDKVGAQAYRLLLPATYRIHNTFHVSLLEPYHYRADDEHTDSFMQAPELIDDEEIWEVEEVLDKVKNKQGVWYKIKWVGWGHEYDQYLPSEELDTAAELRQAYEEKVGRKRKRRT